MTAFDIPSKAKFVGSVFGLTSNTRIFQSPLSRTVQVLETPGAAWVASYELPPLRKDQAGEIIAFLVQLRGQANTFNAFDPDRKVPFGQAANNPGTPLVNGASQTGTSLIIDGAPLSVTGWLLPGDYFSVNDEMKMIVQQVDTDGSGNATLNFEPSLRNSPANNGTITIRDVTAEMILSSPDIDWSSNQNGIYTITFGGFEKLT